VIVDIHTHLGGVRSWYRGLKGIIFSGLNDLLSYMSDTSIDRAVILPTPGVDRILGEYLYSYDMIYRINRIYQQLMVFCYVDPWSPKMEHMIEEYVSRGAVGFGEYKVKLPIDHPYSLEIYRICGELGIPILLHIDDKHNYGVETVFLDVASKYNKTIFIMHGPGWWKHISSIPSCETYPRGPISPGGLIEKILESLDNVYADISATSGYNALDRDRGYAKLFLEKYNSRILFGTDFPCIDMYGGQYGVDKLHLNLLKSLDLKNKTMNNILYKNTERILGI
jgi:predicted TIM-barrel fold metal-dependent hydrolase